jgi:hypothetical protein
MGLLSLPSSHCLLPAPQPPSPSSPGANILSGFLCFCLARTCGPCRLDFGSHGQAQEPTIPESERVLTTSMCTAPHSAHPSREHARNHRRRKPPLRPGLPSDPFVTDLCIAPREAIAPRPASASAPDWGVDAPARQRKVAARRAEREQGPHPGHTCDPGQTHTQPLGSPTAPSGFSFPAGAPFNHP